MFLNRFPRVCSSFSYYLKRVSIRSIFNSPSLSFKSKAHGWTLPLRKKAATSNIAFPVATGLITIVCYSYYNSALLYVDSKDDPTKKKENGTFLSHLVRTNNIEVIKQSFKNKVSDPNTKHPLGWAPLHVAVINGNEEMVKLLLENGADPNISDDFQIHDLQGRIAYEMAVRRQKEFCSYLNPQGNTLGCTPLHYAALISNENIIDLLLKYGADCSIQDTAGHLPQEYLDPAADESLIHRFEELQKKLLEVKRAQEKEFRRKFPLEKKLKESIIGQDGPINSVASAIRRRENGWHDEEHPLVFLFLGSSGIGKTELAKQLAKYLHKGDKEAFIRIDLTEFQTKHEVSKFIGSPPGYVGYEEGGQLTERLKKYPNAVVLLDEVEKAHPDVLNIMLQLFDEGRLTDGKGNTVDCKEAIFIMTSNLGQQEIGDNAAFLREDTLSTERGKASHHSQFLNKVLYPILRSHFKKDEFLGRINEMLIFIPFSDEELYQISNKELKRWASKAMERHKIQMTWSSDVEKFLAEKGYNIRYGARSITHEMEKSIVNEIARAHECDEINNGGQVDIYVDNEGIKFRFKKKANSFW